MPDRRLVVLRANKIFATSTLTGYANDRISSAAEIYRMLDDYGTCYVVLEDMESRSAAMNLFRDELRTDAFVLRDEIPLRSQDERLQGIRLRIYEYRRCGPPNPDAVLDMDIPTMAGSIKVTLSDVLRNED